jgi:hypothetical protein
MCGRRGYSSSGSVLEVGEAAALLGEERGDAAGEVAGVVHDEIVSRISRASWNARNWRWERFAA